MLKPRAQSSFHVSYGDARAQTPQLSGASQGAESEMESAGIE